MILFISLFFSLMAADACAAAPGAGRGMTSAMECGSFDPKSSVCWGKYWGSTFFSRDGYWFSFFWRLAPDRTFSPFGTDIVIWSQRNFRFLFTIYIKQSIKTRMGKIINFFMWVMWRDFLFIFSYRGTFSPQTDLLAWGKYSKIVILCFKLGFLSVQWNKNSCIWAFLQVLIWVFQIDCPGNSLEYHRGRAVSRLSSVAGVGWGE